MTGWGVTLPMSISPGRREYLRDNFSFQADNFSFLLDIFFFHIGWFLLQTL